MQKTGEAFRKTDNQVSGSGGSAGKLIGALAVSGIGNMAGQLAQESANTLVSSMYGGDAGTVFSSALSSAISGASIGTMISPGIGTAVGAAIGGGIGLLTGGTQVFQKQDEAFKSYVQDQYGTLQEQRAAELSGGSAIASGRETDLISFSTIFGDRGVAEGYLKNLTAMANTTPFLYDDLTTMSKTLATFGYGAEDILPVLQTIGDAGAALGMSTGDMTAVAQSLGRMKSSDKASLEYLNILNDRGIGAVGILADSMGVDQGTMYDMISKGQISGGTAVDAILAALSRDASQGGYAGSMAEQSKTFAGRGSTMAGWEQEMQNAAGDAYNSIRSEGIARQNDYYEGIAGSMSEMNGIIGESKAYLENLDEQYGREAMSALLTGAKTSLYEPEQVDKLQKMHQDYTDLVEQYQDAEEADKAGLGAKIQALKDEAESMADSAYNASTGMQEVKDVQIELISAIRENTDALGRGAWGYDYDIAQEMTKGQGSTLGMGLGSGDAAGWYDEGGNFHPYAYGLSEVPCDDFPALLHQGERVLTASQARQADRAGRAVSVTFTGPVTVREEADLDKLARKFAERVRRAELLSIPR